MTPRQQLAEAALVGFCVVGLTMCLFHFLTWSLT